MSKAAESNQPAKAEVIYLGIDAYFEKYVVVRQIDELAPQSAQTSSKGSLLLRGWANRIPALL